MAEQQDTQQQNTEQQETQQQETKLPENTVTIEEAGPCKKKVLVEVPQETIENATDEQYKSLRKDALVPGFRKGRAPRRLLEKRFGKQTTEQVKLKLLAKASESAIKDNKLNILGEPDIDFEKIELPESGPLKFDFEVEVRPDFDLPPLEGIPVTRTSLQVTDEQLDRELEQLRKWSGVWTPRKSGVVELDDQIIADAVLKTDAAEQQEQLDNIEIFVRRNGFVGAVPVEKLDDILVGAKVEEVKEVTVEVPKTYFREQYRGKKVDIKITVKDIKWLKPAELDEIFFKKYRVGNENELRDNLRETMKNRLEQQSNEQMTEQIYKYLLDNTSFDLPLDIVGGHAMSLLQRQCANLMMRGLPREQVEEQMDRLRASSEQQAISQFKTLFVMDKVAEKIEIEVSDEEINGRIAQLAVQQGQRPERIREQMDRDGSLAQFKLQVRESKCIAKLLESAEIVEKEPEREAADLAPPKRIAKASKAPDKKKPKTTGKKQAGRKTKKQTEE